MWRLSHFINCIRGGARSGAWRVREPVLLSEERQRQTQDDSPARSEAPTRPLLAPLCRQAARRLHTQAERAQVLGVAPLTRPLPSPRALWCLDVAVGAVTAPAEHHHHHQQQEKTSGPRLRASYSLPAVSPESSSRADPGQPAEATSRVLSEPAVEDADPPDALSALRVQFATEHDRLMAALQNAAGASVAAQRPRQALECFRRAAALGSPLAWFNAGVCFEQGRGTQPDDRKAAICYTEAARLGHPAAAYNLALLLAAGRVTSLVDSDDVTGLLERAAAGGCAEAGAFLETWRAWQSGQQLTDDSEPELSPTLGRSASLPALLSGKAGSEEVLSSSGDVWSSCEPDGDAWFTGPSVGSRPAVAFYLHE